VRPDALRAFHWEAVNLALCDHPDVVEMMGVCVHAPSGFRATAVDSRPSDEPIRTDGIRVAWQTRCPGEVPSARTADRYLPGRLPSGVAHKSFRDCLAAAHYVYAANPASPC
jgi:hypothetical protein